MALIYYPPTQNGLQKSLNAQLDTGHTTSMTLNNVTGVQNKPGIVLLGRIDSGGTELSAAVREFIVYTGTSGNTLTGLTRGTGGSTDQDHAVGTVVEFILDITWAQGIIDFLLVGHNEADGTHKALTNQELTTPKITTSINDTNGNELLKVTPTASAVNEFTVANAATGNSPTISATGGDTNIDIKLLTKGTGVLTVTGTTNYENNVTDDDDIPNKKYVDDKVPAVASDGWTSSSDTWTYASATSFTISGVDRTTTFTPGTRLKLTQTTAKYFVVTSSSFSTGTTVNITAGTSYTFANAAVTSPYYSYEVNPQGYPSWFAYSPSETWTNPPSSRTTTCKFNVVGRKVTMLWGTNGTANGSNSSSTISLGLPINHAAITTTRQPVLGSFMWTDNATFTDFGAVYSTAAGTITGDCGQTTRKPTIVNISASWEI